MRSAKIGDLAATDLMLEFRQRLMRAAIDDLLALFGCVPFEEDQLDQTDLRNGCTRLRSQETFLRELLSDSEKSSRSLSEKTLSRGARCFVYCRGLPTGTIAERQFLQHKTALWTSSAQVSLPECP